MISSKKNLAIILSKIQDFENPKPELEQYMTPSELAAELLWTAYMDGNIEKKKVADFGCGTGILSFGAALLDAKSVIGFDLDETALAIANKNERIMAKTKIPISKIKFVRKDILAVKTKFDTVIMNPPFGIQKEGADRIFLEKAFSCSKSVYSIHKFGTETFIHQFAEDHGFKASQLIQRTFILKPTMSFHEELKHPVKVMLWKFVTK